MADVESRQYKIYITPRVSEFVYGSEIEISAEILQTGVKTMKKNIDSGDFEVGIYSYGDITIKAINKDGYLGDEMDARSIFAYSRDQAKVRVVYVDSDGESTRFKGLINEEATKEDFEKEEISFKILSLDSVLRTLRVPGGLISNGILASSALGSILDRSKITSVLNYNVANINPANDITIDDGSDFDNNTTKQAINKLLLATNSVFVIDSSDNMVVKSRINDTVTSALSLYGPYDQYVRQNLLAVKKYNRGMHRTFTSITVNSTNETDIPFSLDYGYRQKTISLGFITNVETESDIATKLVNEFKNPRVELEVEVETSLVKDFDLLRTVSINYPLRVKRFEGSFLPIVGDTKIGDTEAKLPYKFGNNTISPDMAFKIIEISENPKRFTTTLKLRQTNEGFLSSGASCYVGFAIIGLSTICGTGDTCAKFNPASIGAAKVGCTKIA